MLRNAERSEVLPHPAPPSTKTLKTLRWTLPVRRSILRGTDSLSALDSGKGGSARAPKLQRQVSTSCADGPEIGEPLERDAVIEQRRQRPLREPALQRDVTGVVGDRRRWEVVLQPGSARRDGEQLDELDVGQRAVLILRASIAVRRTPLTLS